MSVSARAMGPLPITGAGGGGRPVLGAKPVRGPPGIPAGGKGIARTVEAAPTAITVVSIERE